MKKFVFFVFVFLFFSSTTFSFALQEKEKTNFQAQKENMLREQKDLPVVNFENKQGFKTATSSEERERVMIQMREEERASVSAQIQAKRDDLKKKLEAFQNQNKARIIERINARLGELNKKRISEMLQVLERLTRALGRMEDAVLSFSGNESNLNDLILKAKQAISEAKTAVETQSQKEYVVLVTTELAARATVGQTVSGAEGDLQNVRKRVIFAREAVVRVFTELMKMKNENLKESSGSGVLTPTKSASPSAEM